ncbi:MAG: carbonic anhydrase, partial [Planctomycetota bacterium]
MATKPKQTQSTLHILIAMAAIVLAWVGAAVGNDAVAVDQAPAAPAVKPAEPDAHTQAPVAPVPVPAAVAIPAGEAALGMLTEGNARFAAGKSTNPNTDAPRMAETAAKGQHPQATVISCSDSRVPVERVFDRGVGDIFVIRVAGNVVGTDEIGTAEYGAGHLETPLLVVLGHSKCGAVTAAVTNAAVHGSIPALIAHIAPAADAAKKAHPDLAEKELVAETIKGNVFQTIEELLAKSSEVRERIASGKLTVVGAVYDVADGKVAWLGAHPRQAELLAAAPAEPAHEAKPAEHPAPVAIATVHEAKPAEHPAPVAVATVHEAKPAEHSAPVAVATVHEAKPAETNAPAAEHAAETSKSASPESYKAVAVAKVAASTGLGTGWIVLIVSIAVVGIGGFIYLANGKEGFAMFKNMKLGTKIAVGFVSLIGIALVLGGLAVFSMSSVKTTATELSLEKVPQVQLATNVERTSLQTMYATR